VAAELSWTVGGFPRGDGAGARAPGGCTRRKHLAGGDVVTDDVILGVMDTAAPKHEAVHAHSEMLTLCLETLPDKHACSWHSRHLAWPGRDLVATLCSWLTWELLQG